MDLTQFKLGKTIHIWQIPSLFKGDIAKIVTALKDFDTAIIHEAWLSSWRTEPRKQLIAALKQAGIIPVGGSAVYGSNPQWEGETAAAICEELGLPAFVFDAESAFDKVANPDTAATKLLTAFHAKTKALAGWCWWAFWHSTTNVNTIYHPKSILWAAMDPNYGNADFGCPMAYWSWGDDAANAVRYLDASWKQWRELTTKPIIPIGRAYIGDGGTAKPEAVTAFEAEARKLGAVGVGWWSMQHALSIPGIWDALVKLPKFNVAPAPTPEPSLEQKVDILWNEHLHKTYLPNIQA